MVITVKSRVPGPVLAGVAVCLISAAIIAVFAQSTWAWALAVGGVSGAGAALLWLCRPRQGELLRLLIDREKRMLYWVHRGREAEEVPFGAIRAVALEPILRGRRLKVYAIDTTGKWVPLGSGIRAETERFGKGMAAIVGVPLWYKHENELVLSRTSDLGLKAGQDHR
jgi:hypothetical protein